MDSVWLLRDLLLRTPRAASLLIAFNVDPAGYLHQSRRRIVLPDMPDRIWQEPRVRHRLSRLVLSRTGLDGCPCTEAPHVLWPMALLPADRLERLAVHVGAHVLGFRIRSSLSRDHVKEWKSKLGNEAYQFAMNSAALLSASKVLPPEQDWGEPAQLGMSIILAAFDEAPEGMRRRVSLKSPVGLSPMSMEAGRARKLTQVVADIVEAEWFSSLVVLRR